MSSPNDLPVIKKGDTIRVITDVWTSAVVVVTHVEAHIITVMPLTEFDSIT